MNFKFFYLKQNFGIGFYLISLFLLYYAYHHQVLFKPSYDAVDYQNIAKHYIQNGLFVYHDLTNLRLYGFPFLLSFFYVIFGDDKTNLFYTIFISLGYIILAILIVEKLKLYITNYNVLHISFAMNIFLFPYLTSTLADGVSILLWMVIFYLILQIFSHTNKKLVFFFLLLSSFFIGMSIMIRPSNIILSLLLPILFIMTFLLEQKLNKVIVFLTLLSGFFVAVFPQLYINFIFFQKVTFLPTVELGYLQIKWGIENIKYATNLSGDGIPQLYYKNPFYVQMENLGLTWYFSNFGDGVKTILLHIFNVFTYDYYFPYIYDLYPKYKFVTLLYSWFILFFGFFGIYELHKYIKYTNIENSEKIKFLFYIILPIVFLSTLSVLAISAVENRFSLPLVLILLPFSFYSFFKNIKNINVWTIFILWVICAFLISSFVDMQKNIPII